MKFLNRLYLHNLVWYSLRFSQNASRFIKVNCSKPGYAVYEKRKLFQTRLYNYITCSKISNIHYNWIFTTQFNDSLILITNISCDYLNLTLANEYVGDVTIPTQVIKYNQHFLHADQSIILQYLNQIKLFTNEYFC